jgi:uncharacterized protein
MRVQICMAAAALSFGGGCSSGPSALVNLPTAELVTSGIAPLPQIETVVAADGQKVRGWRFDGDPAKPYVVHFHGLGSSAEVCARALQPVIEAGYGLLCASYRGQNGNGGTATEKGLFADGAAFLVRGIEIAGARPVVAMGHSMGGGVLLASVLNSRAQAKIAAVISISAFTRMADMSPLLIATPDRFDNMARIGKITAPLYLIHGTVDERVPISHAVKLRAKAPSAKYIEIKDAPHRLDSGKFTATILSILAQVKK